MLHDVSCADRVGECFVDEASDQAEEDEREVELEWQNCHHAALDVEAASKKFGDAAALSFV